MSFKQQTAAPCIFYGSAQGCRYGNSCRYSHSNPQYVPLCRNVSSCSGCRYGNQCQFRHHNFAPNHLNRMKPTNNNYYEQRPNFTHPFIASFQPPNISTAPSSEPKQLATITTNAVPANTDIESANFLYPCDAYLIASNKCRNICGPNIYSKMDEALFHNMSKFACDPAFKFDEFPVRMGIYENHMELYTDSETDTSVQHAFYHESGKRCPYALKSSSATALFGPILNTAVMIAKSVKYCCNFEIAEGEVSIGIVSKTYCYEHAFLSLYDYKNIVHDHDVCCFVCDCGNNVVFEEDSVEVKRKMFTLRLDLRKKVMSVTNIANKKIEVALNNVENGGGYRIVFGLDAAPSHVAIGKQWWEHL